MLSVCSGLNFWFIFMMCYHCIILFQAKTKIGKYRKKEKHRTQTCRLKTTPRLSFWFLFMICYHCILILFKQKQILDTTGKYRKHIRKTYLKKKPFSLETTLPAQIYTFAWVSSKNALFTRIEHTVQQWDAGNLHECKQWIGDGVCWIVWCNHNCKFARNCYKRIHLTVLDMQFHKGCAVSPAGLKLKLF